MVKLIKSSKCVTKRGFKKVSRGVSHAIAVGNDFVLPSHPLLEVPEPVIVPASDFVPPHVPTETTAPREFIAAPQPVAHTKSRRLAIVSRPLDIVHRYSLISFALLFLLVGSAGIIVGGRYWSSQILSQFKPLGSTTQLTHAIAGLSLAVPNAQLQAELQAITSQPSSITVGTQTASISPSVIKSWLEITPSGNKVQDYLQVNIPAMKSSLAAIANQYVVAPVNQLSVTHTDGVSPSGIIQTGKNGTALTNPGSLNAQAQQSAKSVMNGKGLNFNTPLQTVPFQAVTPAAYPKLLEADVTTDRLYAWQNGQLVNTFLSTDGKPGDLTPIGSFAIWDKTKLQTMVGPGYVQPDVPYINYFDHSGDAIHGNYWRPASVFGTTDTSHGCIGIQVDEAEWVYNWAPIGTPVVTYLDPTTS
jgi:lipoprotein-anchoring transpeptidase ErfK/SrfK